jgi:23S rRNA (pseudouridine1915-N3)-methyltransferase
MNLTLLLTGSTSEPFVKTGLELYLKRLNYYLKVTEVIIPDLRDRKSLDPTQIKEREGISILAKIPASAYCLLLDERGREFTSVDFAAQLQKIMNSGARELIAVVGGAYGVSEAVKQRADLTVSLSRMTFTHQFIRLIFAEQVYRAMTILRNEPYHNE